MIEVPEGNLTLPMDNARKLLADSATFQLLFEADTAEGAYRKAWLGETDDAGDFEQASYPRAIVQHKGWSFRKTSTTGGDVAGVINVAFEVLTPPKYLESNQDAYVWITNRVGKIAKEIFVLSSNGSEATLNPGHTHLNVIGIDVDDVGASDMVMENGNRILGSNMQLTYVGGLI